MAVTSTTYGITTKQLVLGTASDQVSGAWHSTCMQSQPVTQGTADQSALHAALHDAFMSANTMLACSMPSRIIALDPFCIRSTCQPEGSLFQPPQYPEQVYLLDKRLLDPRRPVGVPTEADKMEQLIPYNEVLPLNPSQFATHSQRVAGLRGECPCPHAVWLCKAVVGLWKLATEPHCW